MKTYTRKYKLPTMWQIVPENLAEAMRRAGINQSQLAEAVGVKQPSIGRLLSGDTKTTRALEMIATALRTTPAYLRGNVDDPGIPGLEEVSTPLPLASLRRQDAVEIDEIDLRFGLGGTYLDNPVEVSKRTFSREWLRQFTNAQPDQLVWTIGDGDSMEPTIRSGEVILIDRSQRSPRMGDGIWALAFGDIGMIKRLRPMPDGTIKIASDNQLVRDEIAADGELFVVGRVVVVVRKL